MSRQRLRTQITGALAEAERLKKPSRAMLFTDVFASSQPMAPHLAEQQQQLRRHLERFGDQYDDVYAEDEAYDKLLQDQSNELR